MLPHRLPCAPLALLVGIALAAHAASAQPIQLQSQTRTVGVEIEHNVLEYSPLCVLDVFYNCGPDAVTTTIHSDDSVAPDAGPWVATASLSGYPDAFASQDSEITGTTLRASGAYSATGYYELLWDGQTFPPDPTLMIEEPHAADSSFAATFVLPNASFYRLTGSAYASIDGVFGDSMTSIRLTGPGAQVVAELQFAYDGSTECDPGAISYCWERGPTPIEASGLIPAGTYTLEANTSGVGLGYWKFGLNETVAGSYDVELTVASPVPALSASGRVLLAIGLFSLGAVWSARSRLRNDR